jgi:kynureninase
MVTNKFEAGEDTARRLDANDPLAKFRSLFYVPESEIYVDGNSLGLLSKPAEQSVLQAINEWKTLGIKGWLEAHQPWFYLAEDLGAKCSKLVGAEPEEVVATGTTTVNIHSLVNTFFHSRRNRTKIIADELTFPTDLYALQSLVKLRGEDADSLILAKSDDGRFLDEDRIIGLMDENVDLALLPSVLYRSGQLLDIEYLTEEAHKRDILIGFDCSHSVGVLPHHFDKWDVDFAVWCSYKYLNGGPGGTAFHYLNRRHFNRAPALAGWFGYVKDKQFDLKVEFENAKNAGGWQISSPGILSSAPLEGSLKIILEAGIENIRRKSLELTSYLIYLVDITLSEEPYNFKIGTPREPERRGGHVAVEHKEAMRISEALRARNVITDFRPPNVIRICPSPLYNCHLDLWRIVQNLKEIIDHKDYAKVPEKRKKIS